MMKTCPHCRTVFPSHFAVCPRDAVALIDAEDWSAGMLVRGKYRIVSKVGQGGMGAVYKAVHTKFEQVRALKVMTAGMAADANFVLRFEREALVMSRLQHPNVVRVDDIDESEDGRPFIVMEFVEGRSLRQVIEQEGPLQPLRVCSVARQVAAGLGAAHQLGMVHRDVKPDNIVLVNAPEGEVAKVLDFGIAKLKEARPGDALRTATGLVIGTPQYLSPEQAMGKRSEDLDGRSDLYSLGLVMYQMLTRELPFHADSAMGWLLARLREPARPIQSIQQEMPIPGVLADLVMRCLEADRARRPANAQVLISEIGSVEQELRQPAHSTPVGLWCAGNVIRGRYRLLARVDDDDLCLNFQALQIQPERACLIVAPNPESLDRGDYPLTAEQSAAQFREYAAVFRQVFLPRIALRHPNIERVEQVDVGDDGCPFAVCEWVEGRSLEEAMHQEAPFAPRRACALAGQMAAALHAMHIRGITHGQLSPDRVVLFRSPAGECVRLKGLGRNKLEQVISDLGYDLFLQGWTHLAPEQSLGQEISGSADVYALGVILYRMLTGQLPYPGNSLYHWITAQREQAVRPMRAMRPDAAIPDSLETLVTHCLEKDPKLRPSAKELLDAIEREDADLRRSTPGIPLS